MINVSRASNIMAAVLDCWNAGHKVHIAYAVTDPDGNYIETQAFPFGKEQVVPGTKAKLVQINISTNACKDFSFDDETRDFVYDVGVNGRPFLGNMHLGSVLAVLDVTVGQTVWEVPIDRPDYSQGSYRVVNGFDNKPYNRKELDAKFSKHETLPKEVAELRLVVSSDNPRPASGNGWRPELV